MANHQVFDQKQIPQSRDDRGQEEPEAGLFLAEELLDRRDGSGEVPAQEAVAQVKDATLSRNRHQRSHQIGRDGLTLGGQPQFGQLQIKRTTFGSDAGRQSSQRLIR